MPRRSIVLGVFAMLALGLPAAAGAHHGFDPGRPLPSNNPHAFGIPQEAWEEGTEVLYLAGTDIPIVLDEGDPDLDSGDFWFILRIAESDVLALEVEGLLPPERSMTRSTWTRTWSIR